MSDQNMGLSQIEPQALKVFGTVMRDAEVALDAAYAHYAKLATTLIEARRALGIGMLHGQETLACLDSVASKLMEARGEAVRAHKHANVLRLRLGRPEIAAGDCCPPDPDVVKSLDAAATTPALAVVA